MSSQPRKQIGVIGPSQGNLPKDLIIAQKMLTQAEEVGRLIAEANCILITGGQDGVMEAACKGAKAAGGITVGTPGRSRNQCNPYVDVEICTPIDVGDYLFAGVLSCDSLIVFPGGAGTIAELAIAYRYQKPMIIMKGYDDLWDKMVGRNMDRSRKIRFEGADTAKDALNLALR